MVDLAKTLQLYNAAFADGSIVPQRCELHKDLYVLSDEVPGGTRVTYARVVKGRAIALVVFVSVDPVDGMPCFNVGYAVDPDHRRKGLGKSVLAASLKEMQHGLKRHSNRPFVVEAVVALENEASNRLATQLLCDEPNRIVCDESGEDAFQYLRTISLQG